MSRAGSTRVSFPELKPHFGVLLRMRPEPFGQATCVRGCSAPISGSDFSPYVVETVR